MNPTYKGDKLHPIDCTGDCVVGDSVAFERAVFTGSFRSAKFSHFEMVRGDIVKESYGAAKQQHTFTLELEGGGKTLIKGRNLYKNGVWRTPWVDESRRHLAADEKHQRGAAARAEREIRING
jgi:hypothetical protein